MIFVLFLVSFVFMNLRGLRRISNGLTDVIRINQFQLSAALPTYSGWIVPHLVAVNSRPGTIRFR